MCVSKLGCVLWQESKQSFQAKTGLTGSAHNTVAQLLLLHYNSPGYPQAAQAGMESQQELRQTGTWRI